jgi:hypothetical protein
LHELAVEQPNELRLRRRDPALEAAKVGARYA